MDECKEANNFSLNETTDMAHNGPLWTLMSTFGTTYSQWCTPERKKEEFLSNCEINDLNCVIQLKCDSLKFYPLSVGLVISVQKWQYKQFLPKSCGSCAV